MKLLLDQSLTHKLPDTLGRDGFRRDEFFDDLACCRADFPDTLPRHLAHQHAPGGISGPRLRYASG